MSLGEEAQIDDLKAWLKVPRDIERILDSAQCMREYHEDILYKDHEDTITTNFILRNMQAVLAHLTSTDPRTNLTPAPKVGLPPSSDLMDFARTLEILLDFFLAKGKAFEAFNAMARDAMTVRAGWMKLIWRDDPERTPLGGQVFDQRTLNVAMFRSLRALKSADMLDEDSADEQRLRELDQIIRADLVDQLNEQLSSEGVQGPSILQVEDEQGISLVQSMDPRQKRIQELLSGDEIKDEELQDAPRFLFFDFDLIDIEDIRLDWSITRPEHIHFSNRIGHRTRMSPDEIVGTYDLTPEQEKELLSKREVDKNQESADTTDKHLNSVNDNTSTTHPNINDDIDVWEVWDRETRMVYVFVEEMDEFLTKFSPKNVGPRWFPFWMLTFNDIPGQIYAPSDFELQRSLQDEINEMRTHARVGRKASMDRLLIGKDAMTDEEKSKFEQMIPFSVLEVERPDEIQKSLFPVKGTVFNPVVFDTSSAMLDLQVMGSMPTSGLGGVGAANLATEVSFASQQLSTQLDARKFKFQRLVTEVVTEMAHVLFKSLPIENAKAIAGPNASFPSSPSERQALFLDLMLEIKAAPSGKPDVEKELGYLTQISNIMQSHGMQMAPDWLAKRLAELFNTDVDWPSAVASQAPPEAEAEGSPAPSGQPPGPARGTPGGGQTSVPAPSELPGGQTPAVAS